MIQNLIMKKLTLKENNIKKGFTLIELLIITAIIGILSAIGVPIYQDYLISSKENVAKNNLKSIATKQGVYHHELNQYFPCPKKTLDTPQIEKQFFDGTGALSSSDYSYEMTGGCSSFDASALISNSKAKCFKIDQNITISIISCPKAVTKNAKSFKSYKPPSGACKGVGAWTMVDSKGRQVPGRGGTVCSCDVCGPGGSFYKTGSGSSQHGQVDPSLYKYVLEQFAHPTTGNVVSRASGGGMTYDFSTDIWTTKDGEKYDTNGNRVQ